MKRLKQSNGLIPLLDSTLPREAWVAARWWGGKGVKGCREERGGGKRGFRRWWVLRNARYANAGSNIVQTFIVDHNTIRNFFLRTHVRIARVSYTCVRISRAFAAFIERQSTSSPINPRIRVQPLISVHR